jgi:hypothetical protein
LYVGGRNERDQKPLVRISENTVRAEAWFLSFRFIVTQARTIAWFSKPHYARKSIDSEIVDSVDNGDKVMTAPSISDALQYQWIGIDVSKDHLTVYNSVTQESQNYVNEPVGFEQLSNNIACLDNPVIICEATGGYEIHGISSPQSGLCREYRQSPSGARPR